MDVLASIYFILPPIHRWYVASPSDNVKWVALTVAGTLISVLSEAMHRSRRSAEDGHARLNGIIGSAMDAIITVDEQQRITIFNPAAEKMFGWRAADVLGQPHDLLIPKRFRSEHGEHMRSFGDAKITRRKAGSLGTTYGLRANGEEFPAEASISQIGAAGQKLFTVIMREISDRQRAEETRSLLAAIVESSEDAIVGRDLEGTIVSWNPGAQRLYGYSAEEAIGRLGSMPVPPELGYEEETPLRIKRGAAVHHYETVRLRKNGQRIAVAVTVSPIRDWQGRVSGTSTISRDITERKRAEEQIKNLNASLEQRVIERTAQLEAANRELQRGISERKMVERALEALQGRTELILNSAGDGILGLDIDGKCTFANPAAERILGYTREELTGQDVHVLAHHCLPDSAPCKPEKCGIFIALKGSAVHSVENQLLHRKDGRELLVDQVTTPIVEGGEVVGAVVTFRDVSERHAVQKMKDEFVSIVSHELRTRLTAIRGSLGLLATRDPSALRSARARRILQMAVDNTDRLTRLVNDILDLEQQEGGDVPLVRAECDASELMLQAADLMRGMAEAAEISLQLETQPLSLFVNHDSVFQLLTNLLSNAIKFTPHHSTVRLKVEQNRELAEFRVIDQGPGIPADKLEAIFEPFQVVDASDTRRKGGTGLGLSICRSIVRRHGRQIWVESELGRGSTFICTLPLAAGKETAERG